MKAKLYINGIYWTTHTIRDSVPNIYVALHAFHKTEIFCNRRLSYDEVMIPVMTFTYKCRYDKDTAYYSLIRIDN